MKSDFVSLGITLVIVGLICLWLASGSARDSTDPANGRSNMSLYTDALTGCQYLGHGWSGLTPRLDSNGKQICVKEK